MWRELLGRALTRQPDGVIPTIFDDPLDEQGGTWFVFGPSALSGSKAMLTNKSM